MAKTCLKISWLFQHITAQVFIHLLIFAAIIFPIIPYGLLTVLSVRGDNLTGLCHDLNKSRQQQLVWPLPHVRREVIIRTNNWYGSVHSLCILVTATAIGLLLLPKFFSSFNSAT